VTSHPGPTPLPRRAPRSLLVHVAVDVGVVFLGIAFLFFVVGLPFWLTLVVSVLAGIVAAPFTRRAEEQALARREADRNASD
jgi:hypothetical protein